jgi:hypothetical protein
MSGTLEIIKTPASGHPRAVFFTRSRSDGHRPDGPWLAIAAYEKGYAVVELGDEVVLRGWQEVRLSDEKAIARIREAGVWRERCFFVFNYQVGEILPDMVVLGEEFPISEEADSWRIVTAMSSLAFRVPDMDKDKSLQNLAFSDVFLRQAEQGDSLDIVLRPDDVYGWVLVWCRLLSGGRILRQTLPTWGTKQRAEIGRDVVAILTEPEQTAPSCSRAYSVGWGWNTAHLIAEDVRALGFSSAGDRMVVLRRDGGRDGEWVWDFRKARGGWIVPEAVLPAFSGDFAKELLGQRDEPWRWVCRISPDIRWLAIAAPGRIMISQIPNPSA